MRGSDPPSAGKQEHALVAEDLIRFRVKAELRKRLRALRRTTPLEACNERAAKIIARLEALDVVREAKCVALFWPIVERHEIDLRPFDASLRARGVSVAYPAIDRETGAMSFRLVDDTNILEERGYGFAEPPMEAPAALDVDVVIVPAIAVDPACHRIGYGGGYYDRTLPSYCPPAVSVAVAYDWQVVSEVPVTPLDVSVSLVVTDERTFPEEAPEAGATTSSDVGAAQSEADASAPRSPEA